jgi:hypothetical protein
MVIRPERQCVEDRAPCKIMRVLGSVGRRRPSAARAARDAVSQPVVERVIGQAAVLPRGEILVAKAERTQRLGVTG